MFDVSFSELLVIAVVALLVIGPEKLPKVARTLGALMGRMQRYVAQVKEEVNREVRFEELQKLQQEIQSTATKIHNDLRTDLQSNRDTFTSTQESDHLVEDSQQEALVALAGAQKPVKKTRTRKVISKKLAVNSTNSES